MFILERSREKGKQFSILSKQPILQSSKFPKIFRKEKNRHTHTNILLTETRLLSIKTTGKVLPPEEEERSGKGSGRKIKWCNGKKVRQRERREREHGGGLSRRYVRARARRGERRGVGGQMAHGRPEMIRGRCCCVRSVSVETLVLWGLTYGPRPIYRRRAGDSSFCPSVNLVSRARPTVCLIRRGGRGGGP